MKRRHDIEELLFKLENNPSEWNLKDFASRCKAFKESEYFSIMKYLMNKTANGLITIASYKNSVDHSYYLGFITGCKQWEMEILKEIESLKKQGVNVVKDGETDIPQEAMSGLENTIDNVNDVL